MDKNNFLKQLMTHRVLVKKIEKEVSELPVFASEIFLKQREAYIIPPEPAAVLVNKKYLEAYLIQPLIKKAKEYGRTPPTMPNINSDFWADLNGKKAPGFKKEISFSTYCFLDDLDWSGIFSEAKKHNMRHLFTFREALAIFRMILLESLGKWGEWKFIVPFYIKDKHTWCCFRASQWNESLYLEADYSGRSIEVGPVKALCL